MKQSIAVMGGNQSSQQVSNYEGYKIRVLIADGKEWFTVGDICYVRGCLLKDIPKTIIV